MKTDNRHCELYLNCLALRFFGYWSDGWMCAERRLQGWKEVIVCSE